MQLHDKIVVVTGASMGIGEAVARRFTDEGAQVVMASRNLAALEEARTRIGNLARTVASACDVSSREQIDALLAFTLERHGRIDIWINNAGFGLVDSVGKMDMAECRRLFDTNLFGAIDAMQAVIPVMRSQGAGTIVNVSSVAGYIAVPHMAAYGATKHALNCFTKAARLELQGTGVNVVNVCPGYVKTNFSQNAVRGADRKRVRRSADYGITAERVAKAILLGCVANRREIVVPAVDRVLIWAYRRLPTLFESVMVRLSKPV